jgi:DNA repair protein SbcC/Rad50
MVEILSVTLKNFKAHSDRSFAFSPGTNAISGENGAGKTSILEAIAWVLFDHKGEYKTEDFVRNGAGTGQAAVQFISSRDQRTYDVQRNTRSGYVIYDPQLNEKLNLTRIKEEVLPWLRQHLGVAPGTDLSELFASTIGVPQGLFTVDFQLSPERRKGVFDKVLKVEEYQKTWKDFSSLEKYAKAQTETLDREIAQYDEQLGEWEPLNQQQQALNQEINQVQASLQTWQQKLVASTLERDRMGAQAQALQQLATQVVQLESAVSAQQQLQQRLQQEVEQAAQAVEICTARRDAYQLVLQAETQLKALEQQRSQQQQWLTQRQKLVQQDADRTTQLATLTHQIERCVAAQAECDRIAPQIQHQLNLETQQQAAQQQLQTLQSWRQTLTREQKRLTQRQTRQTQLQAEILKLQALEATIATLPELEAQQQRYQQQLSRIAAATQFESDLRQILAQAQKRGTLHDQQVKTAIDTLTTWQANTPNASITTVLTALGQGGKLQGQLMVDLQGILDDLGEQVLADRLQTLLQQTTAQLQKIRQTQLQYLSLESKQQEQQQLVGEIAEVTAQLQTAQAELAAEPQILQQLAKLQGQLQELDDPRSRQRFLQQEIQQKSQLEKQRQMLQASMVENQTAIALLDQQLATLLDLATEITVQQTARDRHRPDYIYYLEHQKAANSYKPLQQQFDAATIQAQAQQVALLALQQQQSAIVLDPEVVAAMQLAYQTANTQTITLQAQLPEKQKQLISIDTQITKLQAVQAKQNEAQTKLKQQQKVDRFIKFARKAYKEAGPRITELYVQRISREADKLFRDLLNRPNVALEWTRDYEILVREAANTRRFVNLSGGEQMCAALAVRLALLKVLADINIAFFDEPTTNMDRPRRIQLAEAIANIRSFRQLFVISHDDTFEQVTENVILVTRDVD